MIIHFPVKIEGRGTARIGKNTVLNKLCCIGIETNAFLDLGDNLVLGEKSEIILSGKSRTTFGNDCTVGAYSKIYSNNDWNISNNVSIASYCAIFSREKEGNGILKIGEDSNIGDGTIIDVCGNVTIGDTVAIGPNCVLYTHDHDYSEHSKAAWKGKVTRGNIIVREGVWIGANVTILPDVTIGRKSVIAAGSVVTKDVPAGTLNAGVPARVIKVIINN